MEAPKKQASTRPAWKWAAKTWAGGGYVFVRTAMSTEQAASRYLNKLRKCVRRVEQSLKDYAIRTDAAED